MKKTISLCLVTLLTLAAYAQKNVTSLNNKTDSLSYALGQSITNGLKQHLVTTGVLEDSTATNFDKKAYDQSLKTFLEGLTAALTATNAKQNKYNAGIGIGNQLGTVSTNFEKEMLGGEKLNKDAFVHSILSALSDKKLLMDNSDTFLQSVAMEMQEVQEIKKAEELQALHGERITEGVKFLAENRTKEGVITLPSGLQYKVLEEGTGAKPVQTDRVTVHYEGKLLDGTVFDSSYQRGEPVTLGVTQVIKGWIEALQIMPVGSKWTIYVPHDLAYGDRDQGAIKPFSTLIFDVELIDIEK